MGCYMLLYDPYRFKCNLHLGQVKPSNMSLTFSQKPIKSVPAKMYLHLGRSEIWDLKKVILRLEGKTFQNISYIFEGAIFVEWS